MQMRNGLLPPIAVSCGPLNVPAGVVECRPQALAFRLGLPAKFDVSELAPYDGSHVDFDHQ